MRDNGPVCRHCNRRFGSLHAILTHFGKAKKQAESRDDVDEVKQIEYERSRIRKLWNEYWKNK